MRYILLSTTVLLLIAVVTRAAEPQQLIELRTYTLVDRAAEAKLDDYLANALIPALKRQGLGPIGAFDQAELNDTKDSATKPGGPIQVALLIAGPTADAVTSAAAKLADDAEYQKGAADYLATAADKPLVHRISSELLRSFAAWPKVTVPQQQRDSKPRLFELRTYESPTEHLGDLKVEMFNSGEVSIFLDAGINPVFMGQALIGDKTPNLTYMAVFDDDAARGECWKKFLADPAWEELKAIEKYQGTVSKIHKSDWTAKAYSEL